MVDLYIKNGLTARNKPIEVAISDGKIENVSSQLRVSEAKKVIDLQGKSYVSAGWIDDHVHCCELLDLYHDDPDVVGYLSGVTTVIDAGSTGADNIEGFYENTKKKKTNVYAMINVSKTGITGQDELGNMETIQPELIIKTVRKIQDFVVGLKVRESKSVVIKNDVKPLEEAKKIQKELNHIPIMVHIGSNPPLLSDVLKLMEKGDILTHPYNGKSNGIVDENKKIKEFVLKAYQRGVIFDVGHGTDSFNFEVAKIARDNDLIPKSISTDIYSRNRLNGPVKNMATTMEKMLLLGYTLPEVVRMITANPADNFHLRNKGYLWKGMDGDVTIFDIEKGEKELTDSNGNALTTNTLVKPRFAVISGESYSL